MTMPVQSYVTGARRRAVMSYPQLGNRPTADNPYPNVSAGAAALLTAQASSGATQDGGGGNWDDWNDFPAQPASVAEPSTIEGVTVTAPQSPHPNNSIGHPGLLESFIPVWGPGREAIADFQEGNPVGGLLNTGLAALDAFTLGEAGSVAKLGLKGGSHTWGATRKWLGKNGFAEKGQDVHHWLVPRSMIGKYLPEHFVNQPWNLKAMPSREIHMRIHQKYGGARFNPAQRWWYGVPGWAKEAQSSAVGHAVDAWDGDPER